MKVSEQYKKLVWVMCTDAWEFQVTLYFFCIAVATLFGGFLAIPLEDAFFAVCICAVLAKILGLISNILAAGWTLIGWFGCYRKGSGRDRVV